MSTKISSIVLTPFPPRYPVLNVGYLCVDAENKALSIYDDKGNSQVISAPSSVLTSGTVVSIVDSKVSPTVADISVLTSKLNVLQETVASLKESSMTSQVITGNLNDPTKDLLVTGTTNNIVTANAKSIELKNVAISGLSTMSAGSALSAKIEKEFELKDSTIVMNDNGSTKSTNSIKINDAESLIIKNAVLSGTTWNSLMTGQNCSANKYLKTVLIDNCDFADDCRHINIWLAAYQDNAVVTISNCHFKTCEQFLCISDYALNSNNKVTINIINCTIDNYDDSEIAGYGYKYAGIILCDARNTGSDEIFISKNPFGNSKVVLNINNLIVKGNKITTDLFKMGTATKEQMLYIYNNNSGTCFTYADHPELFPTVNIQ